MSTNSECLFIERSPGAWFYILEDYSAPKNSWDWREHASAYGPFTSEDAANEHLGRNHANPGGSCTQEYQAAMVEDDLQKALLDGALDGKEGSW